MIECLARITMILDVSVSDGPMLLMNILVYSVHKVDLMGQKLALSGD